MKHEDPKKMLADLLDSMIGSLAHVMGTASLLEAKDKAIELENKLDDTNMGVSMMAVATLLLAYMHAEKDFEDAKKAEKDGNKMDITKLSI